MSITTDFNNIIQIANDKTLGISTIKYGDTPSIKNVGTANDIKLEITIPSSEQDLDVEIGSVTTGDIPSVKKRIADGKIYFDFVLPTKGDQGATGPQGSAATIEIGKVSIGNMAKVENVGTENKAILNFTLPYASGMSTVINPVDNGGGQGTGSGGSSGGDRATAEELKNVTAGINRSAKATEELESTIADILTQVSAMVSQNNTIIRSVVDHSQQLEKVLGDRIDANKLSIKAIQMTTIDKNMLDDTKDRIASCERTVSLLRGELREVFLQDIYLADKQDIEKRLDNVESAIEAINAALKQLEDINDSISKLEADAIQSKASIELLQSDVSRIDLAMDGKQDAGHLVNAKDLDSSLKSSIDSISVIRGTANQNAKNIASITSDVNNLSVAVQETTRLMADIQTAYAKGDENNKELIDALDAKLDGQTKTFNDVIAEIQEVQAATNDKYAGVDAVYTKSEVNDMVEKYYLKTGGDISGNVNVNGSVKASFFTGNLTGNADSATSADKADHDGNGNSIVETYATKSECNALIGRMDDAVAQANAAAEQAASFADKISSNVVKLEELRAADESMASRLDALSSSKANQTDIIALQNKIDENKESCDTKIKAIEDKLPDYMSKGDIISESQLNSYLTEKINGIDTNAEAIGNLKQSQDSIVKRIASNEDDVTGLKISVDAAVAAIENADQSIKMRKITIEEIDEMFKAYWPGSEDEEPDEPDNPDSPSEPEPDNPENPDEPDTPDNPDEPETPDEPNPDEPENPGGSNDPENPEEPEDPNGTDEPENPDNPDEPDIPNTPEEPENPDNPETPASGDNNQENTDDPSNADDPAQGSNEPEADNPGSENESSGNNDNPENPENNGQENENQENPSQEEPNAPESQQESGEEETTGDENNNPEEHPAQPDDPEQGEGNTENQEPEQNTPADAENPETPADPGSSDDNGQENQEEDPENNEGEG